MNLLKAYEANTASFIELINQFPDSYFNSKPDATTWSAAENVDHIIRSEFGVERLFKSETKYDPERNIDEKIEEITHRFKDRSKKLQAFGVVLPSEGEKSKSELTRKFIHSRKQVTELIKTQDLEEICMKFEHPLFGYMTRKEWIHFNIVHAERHADQINELKEHLNNM